MKAMASQKHEFERPGVALPRVGAAAAALLALFWTAGCGSDAQEEVAPLLVVGIDGLDPVILGELLEAGRVPTFQRFVDEGSLGRLQTMVPTFSPVIWTTIATGQPPEAHGVFRSAWWIAAVAIPLNAVSFATDGIHLGTLKCEIDRRLDKIREMLGGKGKENCPRDTLTTGCQTETYPAKGQPSQKHPRPPYCSTPLQDMRENWATTKNIVMREERLKAKNRCSLPWGGKR